MANKFIFVTGGVVSSLGKGIFASSLGLLLRKRGLKIFMIKLDPYLNVDPGTMSPYQHGEVYVTDDGAETDLDLGHYERWTGINLSKESSVTSGKIFSTVLEKERKGDYLGACVQIVPHVTDEIKNRLFNAAKVSEADVVIAEIGGTVGDIEGQPFLEALRQVKLQLGNRNVMVFHNTLVPYLRAAGETKTKPTQHSVKELASIGIQPDGIVLRSEIALSKGAKEKISMFCNVPLDGVFEADDQENIYRLPLILHEQGLDDFVINSMNLASKPADLNEWEEFCNKVDESKDEVRIALVGKYTEVPDAYSSVTHALKHAGYWFKHKVKIGWIKAADVKETNVEELLKGYDGIIVPGGFGERGSTGNRCAIRYAKDHNIPFLGICWGMQLALVDIARHELGYQDANSTENDATTTHPIISYLPNQYDGIKMGGTLRLGLYDCALKEDSLAYRYYGKSLIQERHRHRYEFNNEYKAEFEKVGVVFSGINPQTGLCEIIELPANDYFVACQFHPEFTSRPLSPNPLFIGFIEHAIAHQSK